MSEKHGFLADAVFRIKSLALMGLRGAQNLLAPAKRFDEAGRLAEEPVLAASESDLWNPLDNAENRALTAGKVENLRTTAIPGIYRAIRLRFPASAGRNVFGLGLRLDRNIARAAARRIPLEATHLVISQNLLPFIAETGALGGRTFDVLMTRLPLAKLHERLDLAHSRHPESPTLGDFRAPGKLVELESRALTRSRKVITPHSEIAGIFTNKVEKLAWRMPRSAAGPRIGNKVLFPASALGRKGAYEMKRLARELGLSLAVAGGALEGGDFWGDLEIERFDGNLDGIALVVYPTYIEHQPRQILRAISRGIPVLTTSACGLESSDSVRVFGIDAFEELKAEMIARTRPAR